MSDKEDRVFWAYNGDGDLLPIAVYRGEQFMFQTRYAGPLIDGDGKQVEFWQVYVQVQDDLYINCQARFQDESWFKRPKEMAEVEATIMACWNRRQEKGYSLPIHDTFKAWFPQAEMEAEMSKGTFQRASSHDAQHTDHVTRGKMMVTDPSMRARSRKQELEEQVKKAATPTVDLDALRKDVTGIRAEQIPSPAALVSLGAILNTLTRSLSPSQIIEFICEIDSSMGEFDFSMQLIKALRRDLCMEIEDEETIKATHAFLRQIMTEDELYMLSILLMGDDTYLYGEDVNRKDNQGGSNE